VLNGGTNALVADISEGRRGAGLSLLGVFFGVGAFGLPLTLGFLVDRFDYSALVAGVGALALVPLLFAAAIRFPAPKHAQGFPLRDGLRLLREPPLLLFGLMLFLQSGMEITSGGWTTSYLDEELGLETDEALFFLSLFWLGMMLARLALGMLLTRRPPTRVLLVSMGVALAGAVCLLASREPWLAAPGIFLLGAGLAAGFPVILGYVGDRYPHLSGTAFSIVLVMALTGGSLLPWLTGVVGEEVGLRTSFLVLPIALIAMAALLGLARRIVATAPDGSDS
jgi:fucose permease